MTTRMLIDARHREETRVAVVQGNRIEEFDFESAERKQLKGNIYLAKVTRVEPSLQAAFVDYGGNRHGFLAFSEIHPDYYQIPKEDREALLREEAEHAAEEAALRAAEDDADDDTPAGAAAPDEDEAAEQAADELDEGTDAEDDADEAEADGAGRPARGGQDDQVEALRQRRQSLRRRYKIQDVIHRRQVLLVQVVKEERGNKGAALTTYLSLAGRYCVLMPNTSHGGGISRKISNAADRKRLKTIMNEMRLPPSMGCIVRTAGLQRSSTEIRRDFDYLARLWDGIREKTLGSSAPALIYGDSDLIKRAIRDIYNSDVDEVVVEGEEGYRQARDFMKMLMPTHVNKVRHYSDAVPLFQRSRVEDQLAAMYNPVVQLKSGGYLVINPTEALVSIDINSGRSTREHNIEQTATQTNLEAADEIARQLRLRDMAGLVVIDFIDMDNGSNVRKVERAMKDALKNDRARIQVGRISGFGLLEMSRQRLRTGVLEASTRGCPHCEGTGLVRTASSAGLSALRLIEDEAARGRGSCLTLRASAEAAFYVLNRKRHDIAEIEERYGVSVEVLPGGEQEGARMSVEASGPPPAHAPRFDAPIHEVDEMPEEPEEFGIGAAEEVDADADAARDDDEGEGRGRRRRRRRRRGGRRDEGDAQAGDEPETAAEPADEAEAEAEVAEAPAEAGERPGDEPAEGGRRRRGRRGRRRRGEGTDARATGNGDADDLTPLDEPSFEEADAADAAPPAAQAPEPQPLEDAVDAADAGPLVTPLDLAVTEGAVTEGAVTEGAVTEGAVTEGAVTEGAAAEDEPRPRRRARARKDTDAEAPAEAEAVPAKPRRTRRKTETAEAEPAAPEAAEPDAPRPRRRTRRAATAEAAPEAADAPAASGDEAAQAEPQAAEPASAEPELALPAEPAAEATPEPDAPAEPPRRGWWQRTFGG